MSLSARIALDPSWRIAALEAVVSCVGAGVAGVALAIRYPAHPVVPALAGMACGVAFLVASWTHQRRARRTTLIASDRLELGVVEADGDPRLVPSTLLWPGFAVVALSFPADGRTVRRPVLLAELPAGERRGLARYLTWALRGGGGGGEREAIG